MPYSATGVEDCKTMVRRILREVLVGREDPEGFFAMCLSVLGQEETRTQFLSLIHPLSTANRSLHCILTSTYQKYFCQVSGRFLNVTKPTLWHSSHRGWVTNKYMCRGRRKYPSKSVPGLIAAGPDEEATPTYWRSLFLSTCCSRSCPAALSQYWLEIVTFEWSNIVK